MSGKPANNPTCIATSSASPAGATRAVTSAAADR
jgi:hypothetical protein